MGTETSAWTEQLEGRRTVASGQDWGAGWMEENLLDLHSLRPGYFLILLIM